MEGSDVMNGVIKELKSALDETHRNMDENSKSIPISATLTDCFTKFIGTQVLIETAEGDIYTGILNDCSDELDVKLSSSQKVPLSEDSEFILSEGAEKEVQEFKKVARLTGDYQQTETKANKAFRTDNEIGTVDELNGETEEKEKEFEPWVADGEEPPVEFSFERRSGKKGAKGGDGWAVTDMFKDNEDKVVGVSTFDANLSQYSNVDISIRNEEDLKRADELVKAIENDQASKRNALLENDDEERDLNVKTDFKRNEQLADQQSGTTTQPMHQQHPSQQQRQQPRTMREGGPGGMMRKGPMGPGSGGNKRWQQDRMGGGPVAPIVPGSDRNSEDSQQQQQYNSSWRTSDWRKPSQSQHNPQLRGSGGGGGSGGYYNKQQQQQTGSGGAYHHHPPQRNFQPHHQSTFVPGKQQRYSPGNSNRTVTTNYETTHTGQGPSAIGDHPRMDHNQNEPRLTAVARVSDPFYANRNNSIPPAGEDQVPQQIPPDPEMAGKEEAAKELKRPKAESHDEEQQQEQQQKQAQTEKEEKTTNDEEKNEDEKEDHKKSFAFNPKAEPFVPKFKDLNTGTTSTMATPAAVAASTFSTTPLMSSQVSTAYVPVQMQQVPTAANQGIPPPNLMYYQQQPQPIMPSQLPSNSVFAYATGNPAQPYIYVAAAPPPNQTVILQQSGIAPQQFIPVSAATLPPQVQQFQYRTGTQNGGNGMNQQPAPPPPQALVDSATGHPIITHPALFASLPPQQQPGGPIGAVPGGISNAVPLFPNFQHQIPPTHYRATGTPNGAGGVMGQGLPLIHPPHQIQLADVNQGNNNAIGVQQQHHHQQPPQFSTPQQGGGGATVATGTNALPLMSNLPQLNIQIHHGNRAGGGTPNGGGQGQQHQPPQHLVQAGQVDHAVTGAVPLASQPQQPMPPPPAIYPPPHSAPPPPPPHAVSQPATMHLQNSAVQPLMNFSQMPPNVVPPPAQPPPTFHGRQQQQQH